MSPPLSFTTRAASVLRLYGWLALIVALVLIVLEFALPTLRDGHWVGWRALIQFQLAIVMIATILLFLGGHKLSPRNPRSRYFAAGLCVLLMLYFPIGTVLATIPLYYLIRGWSETGETDPMASAGPSSIAVGQGQQAPLLLRLVLWNALFIVCLAAAVVALFLYAAPGIADTVGIWIPYIAGVWLLFLGARFSSRRASIIAIAVASSLLFLFQCGIFGIGIVLSPDHYQHRTQSQLSLAAVLVTGVAFVWWFMNAKLSHPKAPA